ncbi:MAG: 16S rRNA (uracil(1498)-N(3))-methyltransferase [Proteobacteria bacterium]|nr:16S rRNA (uracil(1498)-N(3))-methyltransferase [Pseudomonadota bacterium]
MRVTRVYVDAALTGGSIVNLTGSAANHLSRVLRLRAGAAVMLFNGSGSEYPGTLMRIGGGSVDVEVGAAAQPQRESPLILTLAQGISRGERMDLVVQKATELGLTRLTPVITERSVVRLDAAQAKRRREHWRAIAIGACEQCGRNLLPQIDAPVTLSAFLAAGGAHGAAATGAAGAGVRLLLSPTAQTRVADLPRDLQALTVLIGPEGGLSSEEQDAAVRAGFTPLRLGPRVLRTETAAMAVLALLQREFGDL